MRLLLASLILALGLTAAPKRAEAYDMDCAIMLCMAGGFPPSTVCAAAYKVMIIRITPWPSLPPFGICTYAAAPVSLGGSGGTSVLDVSTPEYEWLRKTRTLWWHGQVETERGGEKYWSWSLLSCDGENKACRVIQSVQRSTAVWPDTFTPENGQVVRRPGSGLYQRASTVMIEYGD